MSPRQYIPHIFQCRILIVPLISYVIFKRLYSYSCEYSYLISSVQVELEKRIDVKYYSINQYRTPGTIAERLLGIYIAYLSKCKQIQKQQLIFFKYIKKQSELQPFKKEQVTIVSNFNDNYACQRINLPDFQRFTA